MSNVEDGLSSSSVAVSSYRIVCSTFAEYLSRIRQTRLDRIVISNAIIPRLAFTLQRTTKYPATLEKEVLSDLGRSRSALTTCSLP